MFLATFNNSSGKSFGVHIDTGGISTIESATLRAEVIAREVLGAIKVDYALDSIKQMSLEEWYAIHKTPDEDAPVAESETEEEDVKHIA